MFKSMALDPYFVDKSWLISELIPSLGREKRFFCITRPRRFGKTVMANMVGAFFGKAADGQKVFHNLRIGKWKDYKNHLNKHNVIYIDFSQMPRDCTAYHPYISRFQDGINRDLAQAYPDLDIDISGATWDILQEVFQKTGENL